VTAHDHGVGATEVTAAELDRTDRNGAHVTTLIDDQVPKAIAIGSEDALFELWHVLDEGRQTRIAGLETEEDVDDVRGITAAQNRIVHEVHRRRSLPERIAALKADDDPDRLLPEDTRPRTAAVAAKPKWYPYNRRGWRQL
jgi:hypothetical protein